MWSMFVIMINFVKLALKSWERGLKNQQNCARIYAPENVFYRLKRRNLKKTFFTLLGKNVFDVRNNLAFNKKSIFLEDSELIWKENILK